MPILIRRLMVLATFALARPLAAQRTTAPLDSTAGRIMFSVTESFADAAGRTRVVLYVETEKNARCYLKLRARTTTRADTITIAQWRLESNGLCLDGSDESATGSISLAIDVGRHVLAIEHLGLVDRYWLTITDDAIRVAPVGTPRVSVLGDSTVLWRFPRNSLALRCGPGEHTAWMCAEVFHLLADEPGLAPIEIPTTGRNPYGQSWFGEYYGDRGDPAHYFRLTPPASYARIVRDLQRLHDTYAGRRAEFEVSIRRWTGESWRVEHATWAPAP